MTLPEAVATLREFRKLNLGPDLSLAIDTACNAIDALIESDRMYWERTALISPADGRPYSIPMGGALSLTGVAA